MSNALHEGRSFAFTGNPMRANTGEYSPTGSNEFVRGKHFRVMVGGTEVYRGCYTPPLDIDVSGIVDSFIPHIAEPPESNLAIQMLESYTAWPESRRVEVVDATGNTRQWGAAFRGGAPVILIRHAGDDGVFGGWYAMSGQPRLLTTRTAGRLIVLREGELSPLCLIANDTTRDDLNMVIAERCTGAKITQSVDNPSVVAVDLEKARRQFAQERGVIPSVFDIRLNGFVVATVAIRESDPTHNRFSLKYRNSLGVFERLELTGEIDEKASEDDGEDTGYETFDTETAYYATRRDRGETTAIISVVTGLKDTYEFAAVADMLRSEEVWLEGYGDVPLRVIPRNEDAATGLLSTAPRNFELELEVCDKNDRCSPTPSDPRVFTNVFTDQFA